MYVMVGKLCRMHITASFAVLLTDMMAINVQPRL